MHSMNTQNSTPKVMLIYIINLRLPLWSCSKKKKLSPGQRGNYMDPTFKFPDEFMKNSPSSLEKRELVSYF